MQVRLRGKIQMKLPSSDPKRSEGYLSVNDNHALQNRKNRKQYQMIWLENTIIQSCCFARCGKEYNELQQVLLHRRPQGFASQLQDLSCFTFLLILIGLVSLFTIFNNLVTPHLSGCIFIFTTKSPGSDTRFRFGREEWGAAREPYA